MLVTPATWEAKIGGSQFKASPDKKVARSDLNKQARHGGIHLLFKLLERCR
jgi:hypothetical protein